MSLCSNVKLLQQFRIFGNHKAGRVILIGVNLTKILFYKICLQQTVINLGFSMTNRSFAQNRTLGIFQTFFTTANFASQPAAWKCRISK